LRASGCAEADHSLKFPTTDTDFAPACASVNLTPFDVTTGARATAAAHDALTTAATKAARNAMRRGERMTRAE
jgi:hypothetical protein